MSAASDMAGFAESLPGDIQAFLAFKRARGYKYERAVFTLASLERFVATEMRTRPGATTDEVLHCWLARFGSRKPSSTASELAVVRQFCLFRRRANPDSFVPMREGAPRYPESRFCPHIFTDEEVRRLLDLSNTVAHRKVRPLSVRTLIIVLYCTGLRFGEALRLRLQDVDIENAQFFISESKGRSRIVPFGEDLAQELRRYMATRRELPATAPGSPFLAREDGTAWPAKRASDVIRGLLRLAGMKTRVGRTGPRPYDFRHTYAVRRLEAWYRDGVDIRAALPLLSAYMGHYDLLGTEHYLHASPTLLALASDRFCKLLESSGSLP